MYNKVINLALVAQVAQGLKEFNLHFSSLGFEKTYEYISKCIDNYNNIRPHETIDYLTPNQAHLKNTELKKRWKNYYKKFNPKMTVQSF